MTTPALKAKELGNKAYKAKQFDVAIKHYDEAIALDSTDITFYNNKGGLWAFNF
jgi:stress-induced-phosphoprotein 1